MNQTKPLAKMTGAGLALLLLITGLAMVSMGVYAGFFRLSGYEKTTATVVALEEKDGSDHNNRVYTPTVTYTADGKEYTEVLETYVREETLGTEIKILYDPANPSEISVDTPGASIYLVLVGAALCAVSVYRTVGKKK